LPTRTKSAKFGLLRRRARTTEARVHTPLLLSVAMITLATAATPADSRSLQVAGTAGYLAEWEFNGTVTATTPAPDAEFSGPLTWKHVGVCSVNGPEEKRGEIRFRLSKSGAASRLTATVALDGAQCNYSGDFSGSSSGHMDCSDAKGVPLTISIK
jgi:hypothetical protein